MIPLFLSRAYLRSTGSVEALSSLLVSRGRLTPLTGKALIWTLFADSPYRERDFLWRLDQARPGRLAGEFLILSTRRPSDPHHLFDLETKEFAPSLVVGQRLGFRLRANPVVRRRVAPDGQSKKHDVIMHALRTDAADGPRGAHRVSAVREAGAGWLARQLEKAGGEVDPDWLIVDGYRQVELPSDWGSPVRFSTVDFDGIVRVTDPERLLSGIAAGFGASKAYGCGLMLVRRAA